MPPLAGGDGKELRGRRGALARWVVARIAHRGSFSTVPGASLSPLPTRCLGISVTHSMLDAVPQPLVDDANTNPQGAGSTGTVTRGDRTRSRRP